MKGGGITLPGLVFILFLALKLTGVLTWSWWWITSPLWGCFVVALFVVTVVELIKAMR